MTSTVFVLTMFIAFGITFECRSSVIVLVRCAWCRSRSSARSPYVIVGAFVVGGDLHAADVVSQLLLACPCGSCTVRDGDARFFVPRPSRGESTAKARSVA